MAPFWQELRSARWLTADRMRAYSLILSGFYAIAIVDAAFELKAAGLAAGSLLATPYVLDYDLVVLALAIAFLAWHGLRHGFRDFEISLLAVAWIVPLLSRGIAGSTGIPLGLTVLLAIYVVIVRRAVLDRARLAIGAAGIAQA
jgi:hypothetical protein